MSKNILSIAMKALHILAWIAILGTIVVSFAIRNSINSYNLGTYMIRVAYIDLAAMVVIFVCSKANCPVM